MLKIDESALKTLHSKVCCAILIVQITNLIVNCKKISGLRKKSQRGEGRKTMRTGV